MISQDFTNIKFSQPHLHINHPTKRLQNDLICLFLTFFPFCEVVNVEVGGNFIFTKYLLFPQKKGLYH